MPNENDSILRQHEENRKSLPERKSLAKRKLDYQHEDEQIICDEVENTPPPSQTTVLSMSSSINNSKSIKNKSLCQIEKQMGPPAIPAPSFKSNSEILIQKVGANSLDCSASKRNSMTIKIINEYSPIAVKSEFHKGHKSRLIELKQDKNVNDDSADETELMQSQTQTFFRKSSLRQNNTTVSTNTRTSSVSRLSLASNPFQSYRNTDPVVESGDEARISKIDDSKKKRKRSPVKDKKTSPTIPSSQQSNKSRQISKKKFNHSYESDVNEDENDDDVNGNIDVLKTSPNKKTNLVIIKNKKEKKNVAKSLVIENAPEIIKKTRKGKEEKAVEIAETENESSQQSTKRKSRKSKKDVKKPEAIIQEVDEIHVIPDTQEDIVETVETMQVEPVEIEVETKKAKSKKAARKEKTPKIVLKVTEPDIEPVCDGIRRSKRVKVQARANLKPIYAAENFVDFDGKNLKMMKIVGFEKINNDLVKFRNKLEKAWNDKRIKNNNKEKGGRKNKNKVHIAESDDENEEEIVEEENIVKIVKDVSIVYENGIVDIADVNNNSNENNFNNNNNNDDNQDEPVEARGSQNNKLPGILLSQSYYQYRNKNKEINFENEILTVETENENVTISARKFLKND
jgi:hypothetical protein